MINSVNIDRFSNQNVFSTLYIGYFAPQIATYIREIGDKVDAEGIILFRFPENFT